MFKDYTVMSLDEYEKHIHEQVRLFKIHYEEERMRLPGVFPPTQKERDWVELFALFCEDNIDYSKEDEEDPPQPNR